MILTCHVASIFNCFVAFFMLCFDVWGYLWASAWGCGLGKAYPGDVLPMSIAGRDGLLASSSVIVV